MACATMFGNLRLGQQVHCYQLLNPSLVFANTVQVFNEVCLLLHIRTTSWSANQPTSEIWFATLSASFVYTITARLR